MNQLFTGAGVALITPFTKNDEVDFDALDRVIDNQVRGGMDYLVALGTTAETPTLTSEEKQEIVKRVKNNSGRLPVVVGMGGNDTRKMIREIESTDFNGVNGILVVTPFYNKPSQEGMIKHYNEIAKVSPVPIILYNVPTRTGVNIEAETVAKLAWENENIVAIKEASGILSQITKMSKYTPDHFSVISGDDVLALPIISIGGKGVISVIANALPGKLSQMIHFALDGRYNESRELHFELIELFKLLFKEGNPGGVKALMNAMGTIENELRIPLCPISEATYAEIQEAYHNLK